MSLTALKKIRLERGLQQQTVSRSIGISQGYLSGLENGHLPVHEELLSRLSRYYKVPQKNLI